MNANDRECQVHDFYYKLQAYQKEVFELVLSLDYLNQHKINHNCVER